MSCDLEDWQHLFDERAGILEYDAVFPRRQAEALARQELKKAGAPMDRIVTAKRVAA